VGDTLLVLIHSSHEDTEWQVPTGWGELWEVLLDTAAPEEPEGARHVAQGKPLTVTSRSMVVLRPIDVAGEQRRAGHASRR
jgi:hypothetical protein